MFFPLLESLLQRNSERSKAHVHEFLQSSENPDLLLKSLFTYAAQHDTADTRDPDAVVVCAALSELVLHGAMERKQQESLIGSVIEFLCSIATEPVDTAVLKPVQGAAKVVSIYDVEEAFEQNDRDIVFATVRDILTLMDNRQYFMEIMMNIALPKSPSSIILAQATSEAIGIMDWKNNFAPFLIYHLIKRIFLDRHHAVLAGSSEDAIFREVLGRNLSGEGIQFVSACYQIASGSKIIPSKLKPKAAMRVRYFAERENSTAGSLEHNEGIRNLCVCSSLRSLAAFPESVPWMSKFAL
jgi:hypothetical protein